MPLSSPLRVIGCVAVCLAPLVLGCDPTTDLVATEVIEGGPATGYIVADPSIECPLGLYAGRVATDLKTSSIVPFDAATITFDLRSDSVGGSEFKTLSPAVLRGSSTSSGATFSATVSSPITRPSSVCAGEFVSYMSGDYYLDGLQVEFDGQVQGHFTMNDAGEGRFSGTWTANPAIARDGSSASLPGVYGTWFAEWCAENEIDGSIPAPCLAGDSD